MRTGNCRPLGTGGHIFCIGDRGFAILNLWRWGFRNYNYDQLLRNGIQWLYSRDTFLNMCTFWTIDFILCLFPIIYYIVYTY